MHLTVTAQLAKNVKTPTEWLKLTKHLLTTDINIIFNIKKMTSCNQGVIFFAGMNFINFILAKNLDVL